MNKTERKVLGDLLRKGDIAAALLIIEAPSSVEARPPVKMWKAKRPKLRNKFARPTELLGQEPCGCAIWPDSAVMCPVHEAARDIGPCLAGIERHLAAILVHEERMFGRPLPRPRHWPAFIYQHAARYEDCKL